MGGKSEKNSGKKGPKCPFLALWSGGFGVFWGCLHRVYFGGKKGEKGAGGGKSHCNFSPWWSSGGVLPENPFFLPKYRLKVLLLRFISASVLGLQRSWGGGWEGGTEIWGMGTPLSPAWRPPPSLQAMGVHWGLWVWVWDPPLPPSHSKNGVGGGMGR